MPESAATRWLRFKMNFFPAYRGVGARVDYIADDYREVRIRLPLNWRTRNYVGTIFGGSLYGSLDPVYMIMLIKILGSGYVVWDKSATIRFLKPGRNTLRATFILDDAELEAIRSLTAAGAPIDRTYHVELRDSEGVPHVEVEKVIYIRRKKAELVLERA
jgi:acyl-coenzyme A thioesterase PaaI-like protein